jgi:multidrug efflux pump subunit AcrA (membrane-fusion protein)
MLPGTQATVTSASGAQRTGRVRMVAPTVDPQTRSGLVYVDLPNDPKADNAAGFKAGMFARGEFALGNSQALTVPQQAVVVRDGFNYAFRLNTDQRVSQIKLQIGRRVGDRVEVLDGLSADAVLVASGAGFLNDGDLVKVVSAPAVAPTSASNQPLAPVVPAQAATK